MTGTPADPSGIEVPGARSRALVIASAESIDRARAAGLPDEHVVTLLHARRAWWSQRSRHEEFAPWPDVGELVAAIQHPAAAVLDEVLLAVIRRRLRAG